MHSQIGASSYYRWSKIHGGCPGSVRLSKDIKQTESPYAKEGTQAHDLAYEILKHIIKNDTDLGFDYTKHDQEMLDAVEVYVEYVLDHLTDDTYLEHKFYLKSIHKDLYGTADCVILDKEKRR